MRKTHRALLWTLLALAAAASRAEVVADLYAANVPVASQSSQELAAASRQALADVLVKVSGSRDLLQKPVIAAALAEARDHVQQYSYVRGNAPAPDLSVHFEFDSAFVTDLVQKAGAPFWTANRPRVLAWVVVEDAQGRHFINWESARADAQLLEDEFSRRGVPVQLPKFDPADTAAVSPEDAWRLDNNVIEAASARYNARDIVVGRLASATDGNALGDWSYFHQTDRINHSVTVPDLQAFLRDGVNVVAGAMAARYAVTPSAGHHEGVRLSVTGVSDYADYAAIVRWLEGLELIKYANLEQVQGDRVDLRLQTQADASQLAATIELNERLLPVPTPMAGPESAPAAQLNYQWRK